MSKSVTIESTCSNERKNSSIRCNGVNVTTIGSTGMAAGILHLGGGVTVKVRAKEVNCSDANTTRITSNNSGDVIITTGGSCSEDCSESCFSEVSGNGVHVSSVACNSRTGVNIARRQTFNNVVEVNSTGVHLRRSSSDLNCSHSRHHIYSASSNNTEVFDHMMTFCADNLGSDWRSLGTTLGFNFEVLDQLCLDHGHLGRKQLCYQMLNLWKLKRGDLATRNALLKALKEIDRKDIALRLPL